MNSVTSGRVRPLSLTDLGIGGAADVVEDEMDADVAERAELPDEVEPLPETDEVLLDVRAALELGFAGVILSGPPGTGKSWYAKRIAYTLAGDRTAVRTVQFHTSYQYEDFVEGFVPREGVGFKIEQKTFALICKDAADRPQVKHVLLIDEISRCDVARVFGEALTYIEADKRGQEFTLATGSALTVPSNLVILATMNPWDKGVDELDVALERRFAQIDMPPSADALKGMLLKKGAEEDFVERILTFFRGIQRLDDEMVRLGHAYFSMCVDEQSARRVWNFRLNPFFRKACRLDKEMFDNINRMWLRVSPPIGVERGGQEQGDEVPEQPAPTN